jgi:hypothetical protein
MWPNGPWSATVLTSTLPLMTARKDIGRLLISLMGVTTVVGPAFADFNHTHIFNAHWVGHARFHGVVLVVMSACCGLLALWLLWGRTPDRGYSVRVASLLPIFAWAPFFIAIAVPGTVVAEAWVARVAGIPVNLIVAGTVSLGSLLGLQLHRSLAR